MAFTEHRASKRISCDAPVIIENCQTGEHYDGSLYNYSRTGMYVEMDFPLESATVIRIVVGEPKDSSRPNSCQAKTVWCKEIPGAVVLYNYGIGVQLDSSIQLVESIKNFRIIEGGATNDNP